MKRNDEGEQAVKSIPKIIDDVLGVEKAYRDHVPKCLPTRPSESDMISRPRADAMQRQLDAALQEVAELREENARLKRILGLLFDKLPHVRHCSTVGRCAGCDAVQWCGDGLGAEPCKPDCIVQQVADELLKRKS